MKYARVVTLYNCHTVEGDYRKKKGGIALSALPDNVGTFLVGAPGGLFNLLRSPF